MPRLQVTQVLSWLLGMILTLTGSLIKWWFPCSVLLLCLEHQQAAFLKSGAECLNHKTPQGGSWRSSSLPAMSLPLGPNSWRVEALPGEATQLQAAEPRWEQSTPWGQSQPCPSNLLRLMTWLYQQEVLHLSLYYFEEFHGNSGVCWVPGT